MNVVDVLYNTHTFSGPIALGANLIASQLPDGTTLLEAAGTVSIDWANITGKPSTFPPSAHTHDWTTGITGKPSTFPPSAHSHVASEITSGTFGTGNYVFPANLEIQGDLTVGVVNQQQLLILRMYRSTFQDASATSVLYNSGSGGTGEPFGAIGNLVLQSRSNSPSSLIGIYFVTGQPAEVRGKVTSAGWTLLGPTTVDSISGGFARFGESAGNITAGAHLEVSSQTGTATITPTVFRIRSRSTAADWDTTNPWGVVDFWCDDGSGVGAGVRARIGAYAVASAHGSSGLKIYTTSSSGLFLAVTIDSNQNTTFHGTLTSVGAATLSAGATINGSTTTENITLNGTQPQLQWRPAGAVVEWTLYQISTADNNLYLRDMTNARQHVTYTQGATAATALTQVHSRLFVDNTLAIPSTIPIVFDANSGQHTYIREFANDDLQFVVGGTEVGRVTPNIWQFKAGFWISQSVGGFIDLQSFESRVLRLNTLGNHVQVGGDNVAHLILRPTGRLYWDGQGDSYTLESAANQVDTIVGGATRFRLNGSGSGAVASVFGGFAISSGSSLYLDGGGDTYIVEGPSVNQISVYAGANLAAHFAANLQTFNGEVQASTFRAGPSGSGFGYVRLANGGATHSGFYEWYNPTGTRLAYMGFVPAAGGNLLLVLEAATGLNVNKPVTATDFVLS